MEDEERRDTMGKNCLHHHFSPNQTPTTNTPISTKTHTNTQTQSTMGKTKKKAAAAESKKSQQKRKEKIVDDKTFGLKNKNKSKKVQAHIQSVTNNVMNSGNARQRKMEEDRKRAKAEQKARKKAAEEERNALFGEALMAVSKKSSTKTKAESDAKGRDHEVKKEKAGTSRAMKMMFQMDAKEMEDALKADVRITPHVTYTCNCIPSSFLSHFILICFDPLL